MDSGKLIESLFVAVKRAEMEATRTTAEGSGNDAADTPSAPEREPQHHTSERRH